MRSSIPAPVAHETAKDADDPLVLDREDGELGQQVDLVQHDRLRPLVQPGSVERELAVDRAEALLDVLLRRVDHVQEQPRALEMGEELVPEPDPLARALDQAGDVRDGELGAVRRLDRAEHGRERRERVVRDLRLRVRDAAEERGLAGVRETGHRGVRQQLQPELHLCLAGGSPTSAKRGACRVGVA